MKMIRCDECKKDIVPDTKWNDWHRLFCYIDHLRTEEKITEATFDQMMDSLMSFKEFAMKD